MAKTATTRRRAAPADDTPRPVSGTAPKGKQAVPADAVDVTEDVLLAQKAEDEARLAARREALEGVKSRLSDELHELTAGDKDSAIQARLRWVNVGNLLIEGRNLFTKLGGNGVDNKAFGKWIEDNGFKALGSRPTRAGAIWLAEVYNTKPDLYALFPTESADGEPLRRSPRTLQAWVREQAYEAFQAAWEADKDGVAVASEADKDSRESVAKSSMPNVYEALAEQTDSARAAQDTAQAKLTKAKGNAEREAAMREFTEAAARVEALETRKAILDQHTDEERQSLFIGWKPRQKALTFKEATAEEAAERLFALLKTHPEAGAVFDNLALKMEELQAKLDADAGAVDGDGGLTDSDDDAGDVDDADLDDADLDDADLDDADLDDADLDDADDEGDGDADDEGDDEGDDA